MEERLTTIQESNGELKESNVELKERLTTVEESNDQLEATLMTTMEAVLGVSDIVGACIFSGLFKLYRIILQ